MRNELVTFALLTTLAMPAQSGSLSRATEALPSLGAPPQGSAQWVAKSMRMNGLPMTIQVFESRLTPDAVLAHYESFVKASGIHESRRSSNAPWLVLMLRSPDHFITIHARSVAH